MTKPSLSQIWLMAIRPKTLAAAVSPVLMGTAMAFGDGVYHFPSAFFCLIGALLIQIGTNLANDYYDFLKGVDNTQRTGPVRVTQVGYLKPQTVKWAYVASFVAAGLVSLYLINRAGWPIALIAISAVLSGIFYTAGKNPLGYRGFGEVFVFLFFGPIAVAGTYYVQSFEINFAVILAGVAPGLLSTAILTVNNLRDISSDKQSSKKTLAVRFGKSFAKSEYALCLFISLMVPVMIYLLTFDHAYILLASLLLFLTVSLLKIVLGESSGTELNKVLAKTSQLLLIYSLVFSLGWVL